MMNQEEPPNRHREVRSRQEGARVLYGILALLATSSVHVHIDDIKDDQEDA